MTQNSPPQPDDSSRVPRLKHPKDRAGHGSPPQSRSRAVTLVGVVLALAIIGGVVFAGIHLIRTRRAVSPPTAATPTELPTPATSLKAALEPPPLACDVPGSVLTKMLPRQKLAQLLMVGVTDEADARRAVDEGVGGIFITSWTNLSLLTSGALKTITASAGRLGLAVSVDEEGGRVQRLSSLTHTEPSARVLAKNDSPEQVYQQALKHGIAIRDLGITIDFAPVVDVTDAPDDTVIGDRSFGKDAAKVTAYAGAYAKGLRDAHVLPVLKHFPGHGHASGDSHLNGVVTPPLDELRKLDLVPYQTLTTELPVGVMIGHMVVPGLTHDKPASLSQEAVNLLRTGKDYGGQPFNGPVFTDDLSTMKAITDKYSVPEAVLRALQAGADTALWVSSVEVPAVLDRLEAGMKNHELDPVQIDNSVRRMATAKAINRCGH